MTSRLRVLGMRNLAQFHRGKMADFGTAGKCRVHVREDRCVVDTTAGQKIACTLEVRGALPLFTFGCAHNETLASPQGPPSSRYDWSTFDTENSRASDDAHVLTLRFSGGAVWYRFRMDLVDARKATIATVKDVEYESTEPGDVAEETIRVRTT